MNKRLTDLPFIDQVTGNEKMYVIKDNGDYHISIDQIDVSGLSDHQNLLGGLSLPLSEDLDFDGFAVSNVRALTFTDPNGNKYQIDVDVYFDFDTQEIVESMIYINGSAAEYQLEGVDENIFVPSSEYQATWGSIPWNSF